MSGFDARNREKMSIALRCSCVPTRMLNTSSRGPVHRVQCDFTPSGVGRRRARKPAVRTPGARGAAFPVLMLLTVLPRPPATY